MKCHENIIKEFIEEEIEKKLSRLESCNQDERRKFLQSKKFFKVNKKQYSENITFKY